MRRLRMADLASWRRGLLPFAEGGWLQLNSAGASPTSQEVHDATTRHLQLERDVGGYEALTFRFSLPFSTEFSPIESKSC